MRVREWRIGWVASAILIAAVGMPGAAVGQQEEGSTFSEAYARLKEGPQYQTGVPTGRIDAERVTAEGTEFPYVFVVPSTYDPARSYPVRFMLHGGIGRPLSSDRRWANNWRRSAGEDWITVLPASWNNHPWWAMSQVENLHGILSEIKATYNVDENRVFAAGISDGGTGVYFLAFKDTTPWAGFLPFIGHPGVLMNPRISSEGQIHVGNLTNKPLFIVNGEVDRLYPVRSVRPFLESFEDVGVDFEFRPQPGGHDMSWLPDEAENLERFFAQTMRDPLPDRVVWAAESGEAYSRAHWVVIDDVGPIVGDRDRAALARLTSDGMTPVVDVTREGNSVTVSAYRVRSLRLLISPDAFDLSRPIRVEANGTVVFDGLVTPSVETLHHWSDLDRDRTMLFAAEIEVPLQR